MMFSINSLHLETPQLKMYTRSCSDSQARACILYKTERECANTFDFINILFKIREGFHYLNVVGEVTWQGQSATEQATAAAATTTTRQT